MDTKSMPVFNEGDMFLCQTCDTAAKSKTTAGMGVEALYEVDPDEAAIRKEERGSGEKGETKRQPEEQR